MLYKIGKVYRVICLPEPNIQYVGSTLNSLRNRWSTHKNIKQNKTSLNPFLLKYGIDNFKIVLIKEYLVVDRKHLASKEQLWINKIKCINVKDALKLNNVKHNLYGISYRKSNRETLNIKSKLYNTKHKDVISIKKKLYYIKNKTRITKILKEKYDKIIKHNTFTCGCSKTPLKKSYEEKHKLSKKHIKWKLNSLE